MHKAMFVKCDIECHFHDNTSCAITNAYTALESGAIHIDTSVSGIGERNGIPSLGGLLVRMYVSDCEYVLNKYNVKAIRDVAKSVEITVSFNNYITGYCASTHKAGIHAQEPFHYEIIRPQNFGISHYVSISHRLTGWNVVKNIIEQLQLTDMINEDAKKITKELADVKALNLEEVNFLLRKYHNAKLADNTHLVVLENLSTHDQLLAVAPVGTTTTA